MEEITLEKNYYLLDKLTTYVMNEVPNRGEMNEGFRRVYEELNERFAQLQGEMNGRFTQVNDNLQFIQVQLAQKADREGY